MDTLPIQSILKLEGLQFIKKLLAYEKERFDNEFQKGSVYEKINADFGIFPENPVYPVYFTGNIENPKGKIIFIGINPGYNKEQNAIEQLYLNDRGLYDGYCNIFYDYFKNQHKGLTQYFANIAGFLKRLYNIKQIDWDWLQENFINLELIPYHSSNTSGLRINSLQHYYDTYFQILIKLLGVIRPEDAVFINGMPSFEKYFLATPMNKAIGFKKIKNFYQGRIANRYDFIGLPFLTRVAGGKDKLVENIKAYCKVPMKKSRT